MTEDNGGRCTRPRQPIRSDASGGVVGLFGIVTPSGHQMIWQGGGLSLVIAYMRSEPRCGGGISMVGCGGGGKVVAGRLQTPWDVAEEAGVTGEWVAEWEVGEMGGYEGSRENEWL